MFKNLFIYPHTISVYLLLVAHFLCRLPAFMKAKQARKKTLTRAQRNTANGS